MLEWAGGAFDPDAFIPGRSEEAVAEGVLSRPIETASSNASDHP